MNPGEALQQAQQELNRADHSIAVSLKYTRTVDVIRSIVERLINAIGFCLDTLLAEAKAEKKISEVPELARLKVEEARRLFPQDKLVMDFCDFYLLLRRIHKAKFEKAQEYRRHVTMTAELDGGQKIDITIDIISEYFEKTKEFYLHILRRIQAVCE